MDFEEKLERVIYYWRRYEGKRTTDEFGEPTKVYSEADNNELSRRIDGLIHLPELFDWNEPTFPDD